MATTVIAKSGEDLKRIKSRAKDYAIMGQIVASTLEAVSQRSFEEQKLGDIEWPQRYPNQDDPMVNLAALVNWTSRGGEVSSRFFDRRPALMGIGDLKQSIRGEPKGQYVEVGSMLSYAAIHQWGGPSSQPVNAAAKKTIGKYIGHIPDGKGGWKKNPSMSQKEKAQREKYWFKMFPLLGKTELETQVNARPFLGITPEAEDDIAEGIEFWVAKGQS